MEIPETRTKMKTQFRKNQTAISMKINQKLGKKINEVLKEFDPSVNLKSAEE